MSNEFNRIHNRIDEIDLALTLVGERDEPLPMGEEDALRAELVELRSRLSLLRTLYPLSA
jgi:hypothetical protein